MGEGGHLAEWLSTAAAILSAVATVALAWIARSQLGAIAAQTELQGERERKWRTLEICSRIDTDPLLEATTKRIWDQSKGGEIYDEMIPVRRDIINLLNYLDSIAVGIAQGFYVEQVARDHLDAIFRKAEREFLNESRANQLRLDRDNYTHVISLVNGWKKSPIYDGGV